MRQVRRAASSTIERYTKERPASAATVEILSSEGDVLLAATAATIDPATTTIAAGLDHASELTLTSSANFVAGRRYVIAGPSGRRAILPATGISATGNVLSLGGEVPFLSTGGTAQAYRLSAAVTFPDETYLSALVTWRYKDADGVDHVETDTVDIVRRPFELDVDETRVLRSEQLYVDTSGRASLEQIEQAVADVAMAIIAAGKRPELCQDRDILQQAAVWRVCELRHSRAPELRELFERRYKEALSAWEASKSWYDTDDSGTEDEKERIIPPTYMRVG